jgi:hypothetical protein
MMVSKKELFGTYYDGNSPKENEFISVIESSTSTDPYKVDWVNRENKGEDPQLSTQG